MRSVDDFIHAVGVVEFGSAKQMHLYVDQLPVLSTGLGSIADWAGNNDMGISATAQDQIGGNPGDFGPFDAALACHLFNCPNRY